MPVFDGETIAGLESADERMHGGRRCRSEISEELRPAGGRKGLRARDRELQAEEAEIARLLRAEESRWAEVYERLSQLEQSLARPR